MPCAPHRIGDAVDVEPVRQGPIGREDEAAPDDGSRRGGRPRGGGGVRERPTHERPRQHHNGNGKKPCDADCHRWMVALCDKSAKTPRARPSLAGSRGRRRSLERATTPGGRETHSPGGARCSRPPTMGDIKSGPPFGHTAPEDAQPDRAAHVSTTRRLRRLPSGPPHRVAPVSVWSGGDRSCSRRSLLRPPPLSAFAVPPPDSLPAGRKGVLHPSGGHTAGYCACTVGGGNSAGVICGASPGLQR